MTSITAQVSVYPLRQRHLSAAIKTVLQVFHEHSLRVETTGMATLIAGDNDIVFDSLKEAFQAISATGDAVMVVTVSNACQTAVAERKTS